VFAIFLVGVVLTTVRAVSKSLAASFIVHVAYNGTIALAALLVTSFYRHMERLKP
jgi:membrane protease YdiL (CAAX protease family)